jgi:carbon storage regulator CsrA
MLVLSRKAGEKLVIGSNITVEVLRIQGNRITLGISAPQDVKIMREELRQTSAKITKQPRFTHDLIVEDGVLQAC